MTALQVDATGVVLTGLRSELGVGFRCVVETPDDLENAGPVVKVVRAGGGDDGRVLDQPTFVLDIFTPYDINLANTDAARQNAYTVIGAMYALRGQTFNGATFARVRKLGGPTPLPYDNGAVRRQSLTFQVGIKPA